MKRLFFTSSFDKAILSTEDVMCEKDILKGEIYLTNKIQWTVFNSVNEVMAQGEERNVETAKRKIKQTLIKYGAYFEKEYRKYKI